DRVLRLHGDAERPRDHASRGPVRSGLGPRPHELLPRPRILRPHGPLEPPALAQEPLHVHGPQRPLAHRLLRHPTERRGGAGRPNPNVAVFARRAIKTSRVLSLSRRLSRPRQAVARTTDAPWYAPTSSRAEGSGRS